MFPHCFFILFFIAKTFFRCCLKKSYVKLTICMKLKFQIMTLFSNNKLTLWIQHTLYQNIMLLLCMVRPAERLSLKTSAEVAEVSSHNICAHTYSQIVAIAVLLLFSCYISVGRTVIFPSPCFPAHPPNISAAEP